jgi:hypothetical protein
VENFDDKGALEILRTVGAVDNGAAIGVEPLDCAASTKVCGFKVKVR